MKILLLLASLLLIHYAGIAQDRERWPVKTLTDGFKPDTAHPKKATVKRVQKKKKIKVGDQDARLKTEKKVVTITGTIVDIKRESDGDYHIEVTDNTMDSAFVCETVDPSDADAKKSPYAKQYEKVWAVVTQPVLLKKGDKVTFTGVLFQDQKHGLPSKLRTRNYIEMHPVLKAKKY